MCGSPSFFWELGNCCDTSPCCMTIHYWITGVVTSICSPVPSTKPCHVPSERLEAKNDTEGQTTDDIYGKEVFCMATNGYGKYTCTVCNRASHPRWKAEAAYCHLRLASYGSTRCSYTLPLYILPNISLCCYLWVQFTYLNELYGECNRTCVNSGYQVLLSNFCRVPGMRLYNKAI